MYSLHDEDSYNRRRITVFRIRPMKKADLQRMYQVGRKTIEKWLHNAGIFFNARHSHYLSIDNVRRFISHQGLPEFMVLENYTEDELQSMYMSNKKKEMEDFANATKDNQLDNDEEWGQDSFSKAEKRKKKKK